MRRMDKVFTEKGIIFEADEYDIVMKGAEYDTCRQLVDITKDFIITIMYSAVLDPIFYIYDRHTFDLIAEQDLYPSYMFANEDSAKTSRTWGSYAWVE